MPRKTDLVGIETRTDSLGREQYRAYLPHPQDRNRKLRGRWTYSFPEARGWRVRMLARKADGVPLLPGRRLPTIEAASGDFVQGAKDGLILSRRREPYAPKTLRGYGQSFRDWINPELGNKRIDELRRSDVQRFVDGVGAVRAGGTTRNITHALGALYSYLLPRYDELGHDPTLGIEKPRPGSPRERYADPEEIEALLAALPHDLAMPYALAFLAGLRHGEIQALPVDCIDMHGGWIAVRYALDPKSGFKGPKSGAGERSIPILESLKPYLRSQLAMAPGPYETSTERRPGTLLLPSYRETKWGTQTFGTPFTKRCRDLWALQDLEPIGLHEARHSFATALVRAGYDLKLVSEWVGHAQASTTLNIYAKRRGRSQEPTQLADLMNRYLAGDGPVAQR